MNGKGSAPRNCFSKAFRTNHDEIDWRKTYYWVMYFLGEGHVQSTKDVDEIAILKSQNIILYSSEKEALQSIKDLTLETELVD